MSVKKRVDYCIAVERFTRVKKGNWGEERGQVIYGLLIGNENKLTRNKKTAVYGVYRCEMNTNKHRGKIFFFRTHVWIYYIPFYFFSCEVLTIPSTCTNLDYMQNNTRASSYTLNPGSGGGVATMYYNDDMTAVSATSSCRVPSIHFWRSEDVQSGIIIVIERFVLNTRAPGRGRLLSFGKLRIRLPV